VVNVASQGEGLPAPQRSQVAARLGSRGDVASVLFYW
jgi:hypothetical protein